MSKAILKRQIIEMYEKLTLPDKGKVVEKFTEILKITPGILSTDNFIDVLNHQKVFEKNVLDLHNYILEVFFLSPEDKPPPQKKQLKSMIQGGGLSHLLRSFLTSKQLVNLSQVSASSNRRFWYETAPRMQYINHGRRFKNKELLIQKLIHFKSLQYLALSNCYIFDERLVHLLAIALKNMGDMRILHLEYNLFEHGGMTTLAPSLGFLTKLVDLDLCHNYIDAPCMKVLAPELGKLLQLKKLDISANTFGSEGMIELTRVFVNLTKLEELYLSRIDFDRNGVLALSITLPHLTNLEVFDLDHTYVKDEGIIALAPALAQLVRLKKLCLCNVSLHDVGMLSLGPALSNLINLRELYLNGNELANMGLIVLIPFLASLVSLETLELEENDIESAAVIALVPVLINMPAIKHVSLLDNADDFSTDVAEAIAPIREKISITLEDDDEDDDQSDSSMDEQV